MRLARSQASSIERVLISAPRPSSEARITSWRGILGQQPLDGGGDGEDVVGVGAKQDGLRQLVVLGLAEQVHRHPVGGVLPSASTRISLGPAIMSMPTVPKTCRFALAT